MRCSRCGAKHMGAICPRCGRTSGGSMVGNAIHAAQSDLPGFDLGPLRRGVRRFLSRNVGAYARFVRGDCWLPGERELNRVGVLEVTVYAVEGHTPVMGAGLCALSTQRLVAMEPGGAAVEVPLRAILSAHVVREDRSGARAGVCIVRVDGRGGPEGDVRILLAGRAGAEVLCAAIQGARAAISSL